MRQKTLTGFFWRALGRPLGLSSRARSEEELLCLLHDTSLSEADRCLVEEQLFVLVRERIGTAVDGFCGALAGMERDDIITEVWLKLRRSSSPDLRTSCLRRVARQIVQSKLRLKSTQSYRQEPLVESGDRITRAIEGLTESTPSPMEQLCANELMQRVRQQLGNENAAPLILNSVYGWEHQEIAAWLGIHEEASKKRAQRAVARLRTLAETDETFKALFGDE
ncbi:sigma factor-like helix-turn-helix DNA-binding protein [Armatimonas sp.]|uniref:RNA polymerase sigma factor n=1 Tax=Armatimonas sp. TaxID=1872638 RepID=UPI00286D0417|nr:sigma factor-like helix-turn-helix DNA-binding protein [Armatimonas sp.]